MPLRPKGIEWNAMDRDNSGNPPPQEDPLATPRPHGETGCRRGALMRRVLVATAIAQPAILAVLCAIGAFFGAERAAAMFNSPVLAVFWFVMVTVLLAAVLRLGWRRRAVGLLALHLGPLLIVGGAIVGSAGASDMARRLGFAPKIRHGFMQINEGQAASTVFDKDGRQVGSLDFQVGLGDFWIERYPPRGPWRLHVTNRSGHGMGAGAPRHAPWSPDQEIPVPDTDLRIRVLRYLPHARAVLPDGGGGACTSSRPTARQPPCRHTATRR